MDTQYLLDSLKADNIKDSLIVQIIEFEAISGCNTCFENERFLLYKNKFGIDISDIYSKIIDHERNRISKAIVEQYFPKANEIKRVAVHDWGIEFEDGYTYEFCGKFNDEDNPYDENYFEEHGEFTYGKNYNIFTLLAETSYTFFIMLKIDGNDRLFFIDDESEEMISFSHFICDYYTAQKKVNATLSNL